MRDKDLVALLTLLFFLLYFLPSTVLKFISVAFILFFSPGFFIVKIYKNVAAEESLLLAAPVSLGITGLVAIFLAAFSMLSRESMLVVMAAIIVASYLLAKPTEIRRIPLHPPEKMISLLLALMLITMGAWLYAGYRTSQQRNFEVDMAIKDWPHNATLNSTLIFVIYIKNWNCKDGEFHILFSLNNRSIENKSLTVLQGESKDIIFYANAEKKGENLASFDLFIDGKFYTNVHIYFSVS